MADIVISQSEADLFLSCEKHSLDERKYEFPSAGGSISIPIFAPDLKEEFLLDIRKGRIAVTKATYQNRAHKAIVLMRLDLDGPPHGNPDGSRIDCPHVHIYKEGYGDKWAYSPDPGIYSNLSNHLKTLDDFMSHLNITKKPEIESGLFA